VCVSTYTLVIDPFRYVSIVICIIIKTITLDKSDTFEQETVPADNKFANINV